MLVGRHRSSLWKTAKAIRAGAQRPSTFNKGGRGALKPNNCRKRIGAWPSGKATGFGPVILGSNPSAPATAKLLI